MTILVDMDDVIEDLQGAWLNYLNRKYGMDVQRQDIKEWDMQKAYPTLSKEEVHAPMLDEELWKSVKPIEGAVYYLAKLIDEGYDMVIVTASYHKTVSMKIKNVLEKYFPFIPYENVVVASRKQLILGDVLIDDYPKNLIGGRYKGILFDAPYNQDLDVEKYKMYRVKGWSEIYELIHKMEAEELADLINELPD